MFQLKWIWQNMEGMKGRYVFALFSTAVLAGCELVNPMITATIMDTVFKPIEQGGAVTEALVHTLVMLVLLLIGFTLFRTTYQYFTLMNYEKVSQGLIYKLRRDLYANMQRQDMRFFSQNRTGDLMTRLTGDMDMIRHVTAYVLRQILSCAVLFVSTAIAFLVRDWLFALTLLAVTPFIYLLTMRYSKRVGPLYVDLRERLSLLNTAAQENISGNRVVKAFAREDYEEAKFEEKNRDFKDANLKATLLWLRYAPFIDGLSQSLSVAVLLVGGIFLINGRISIGTFTFFNSLSWTLTNPMRQLGMLLNDLQRFFASAAKIIELYYARSTIADRHDAARRPGRMQGAIEFSGVGLKLNNTEVLKDVSLKIEPGETVAVMGPTGSGKTSLINLIPRFFDPTEGALTIDGLPVNRWHLDQLRGGIGIATQDVFLFSDTVDGNIAYGDTSLSEEEVAKFARIACVDFINKLPQGFDTIIGERGTGLSGGQKQRIALARALAVRPSILILDDTTSAVDMETEKYIQGELANLDFNCTKIIIAQRISTTKRADKIVILDQGRIVDVGTHAELCAREGYYRDVFLLQNGSEEAKPERKAAPIFQA